MTAVPVTIGEPIPVKVTRYRCDGCPRSHSSKSRAREHMTRCWYRPENKTCKTCKHFEPIACCGQAEVYQCYTPYCPDAPTCAVDVDLSGENPMVGCPKWEPSDEFAEPSSAVDTQ